MPDKRMTLQERLNLLRRKFISQLGEKLDDLEMYEMGLEQKTITHIERDDLMRLAHQLSGTGTTFGFPLITKAANILEQAMRDGADDLPVAELVRGLQRPCKDAWLSLPGHEQGIMSMEAKLVPPTGELPQILVVDDDPIIVEALKLLLQEDAHLHVADNLHDAIQIMQTQKLALVLLDDVLPGSTYGSKFLEFRHEIPEIADVPIVMLTGSNSPAEILSALRFGAAEYITKPFEPEMLLKKLRNILKRQCKSVLIADDDIMVHESLKNAFEQENWRVLHACDGREALRVAYKEHPSIVLLDRRMPLCDGEETLERLRDLQEFNRMPVIFLSMLPPDSDVMGRGDGYLRKPVNALEVADYCEQFLEAKQREI